MKKICLTVLCVLLAGCRNSSEQSPQPTEPGTAETPETLVIESYTKAVKMNHVFHLGDETVMDRNTMDGVLEADETQSAGHIRMNYDSNGLQSEIDGWYTDGNLYNTYNGVEYYEKMSFDEFLSLTLIQEGAKISEEDCLEIQHEGDTTIYVIDPADAKKIISVTYDMYDVANYAVKIVEMTVKRTEQHGRITGEEVTYTADLGKDLYLDYNTSVNYLKLNSTEIIISRDMLDHFKEYVSYEEIDVDAISDEPIVDDSPEDTVTATFEKRIIGRLNYQKEANGTYTTQYNENESYNIDFTNCLFTYKNRSSTYVYNWRSDTGGFGSSCVYDFRHESGSDSCQESTLDMIKNVRMYFELELYYCGLSLDDLIAESTQ